MAALGYNVAAPAQQQQQQQAAAPFATAGAVGNNRSSISSGSGPFQTMGLEKYLRPQGSPHQLGTTAAFSDTVSSASALLNGCSSKHNNASNASSSSSSSSSSSATSELAVNCVAC
jgi:hypothetical protein